MSPDGMNKTNRQEGSVVRETNIHNHYEVVLCCQGNKNVLSACGYGAKVDQSRCKKNQKRNRTNMECSNAQTVGPQKNKSLKRDGKFSTLLSAEEELCWTPLLKPAAQQCKC